MDACGVRAPGALLLRKSDPDAKGAAYANGHDDGAAAVTRRPATPRRHPSPNAGRASAPAAPSVTTPRRHPSPNASQEKRSQSTERRAASPASVGGGARAAAPSRISAPTSPSSAPSSPTSSSSSSSTPVRDAVSETQSAPRRLSGGGGGGRAPDGLWPSMRNLSSSLQLDSRPGRTSTSPADQTTRTRDASVTAADRKRSPMRGVRNASELPENPHAKVIDHHRWPAMMGGRVSGSAMSRSVDLTDRMNNRPGRSLIPSRGGASPKKALVSSSAADTLSRSIDLADKIDRLVSSSRGESPRTSSASNGTSDTLRSITAGKDARPAALAIPSRGISPVRTCGTRAFSKSMDLTEKDNSTFSSAVSSPGISPTVSVSSVSNATSQTTKSSERPNVRASSPASSRGRSPRTPASGSIDAVSKNIDTPEKEKRPASSRGSSPRRRLASDGVNAIVKSMDFAEKDSRTIISSRGVSPRRRLASDGIDAIPSTVFSEKDSRPSTSSSLRGASPRKRLGSDGISPMSKGLNFADKANMPSTSSVASRGISPRAPLVSDCAGTTSKQVDFADKDNNRPSTSYATSRGMSPRRRLASDGISSTPNGINFAEKDGRTVTSSAAHRGISTIRRLASDGADTIPKNMNIPEKFVRPSTSAGSRGRSPRRRLASDGLNIISKSMELSEKDTKPATLSAAWRGLSPRRRLAASDSVEAISKGSDFSEKEIRSSTSSMASRGVSPRRRLASDNIEVISKSSDFVEKETRSSTSSVASRGTSPRRRLASDGVNNLLKSADFAVKDYRPSTSSAPLRGTSPRSRVASNSIDALSRSMKLTDKESRPSTSSGPSGVTLERGGLASGGVMDPVDKSDARSSSSAASGETSHSRLDGTDAQAEVVEFADEANSVTPDDCSDETSESMHSGNVGTGAASLSIAVQDRPPSRSVSDVSNMSQNVNATQERDRAISVKIPSRGTSPRRKVASDGIDTIPKSMDFTEKDKRPINSSVPSRGMSPRRTTRVDSANIMSKSMDFSDKCNGKISSVIPSRVVSTRKILGPDGANAMSRSVDLADNRQPVSSTVASRGISPRKMPSAYNRVKGPELCSGDVGSPGSADGNGSQEENATSSPYAPSNNSEKFAPSKQLARTLSSPSRGLLRPSSPTKASSTSSFASRRLPSPLRIRPSTPVSPCSSGRSDSPSSILSYIGDATRGKKSPSHMEDAHQLRLLYNRNLQWRFTNAYVDEMLSIQKMGAETMLYSVWDTNTRMFDSMVTKRSYVQRLRQEVKLGIVLKEQMDYLDQWAVLQTDHSTSLSGAIEALRASTLRLPVTGGAKADVLTVKNAVSSAVDIMQAMGSSVCNLLTKLQATHSLVTELSAVAAKESSTLNRYRELLATAAALQVHESSLRTQLIQQTE